MNPADVCVGRTPESWYEVVATPLQGKPGFESVSHPWYLRSSNDALEMILDRIGSETQSNRLTQWAALAGFTLHALHGSADSDWCTRVIPIVRQSRAFERFQEDPFTNYAFRRQRGYPGDARLLDHIYRPAECLSADVSDAGLAIFRFTGTGPAARAVRNRQSLLARKIDGLATSSPRRLRVGSLACGHLREADLIGSLQSGLIEKFWAIDQDDQSIDEVVRSFDGSPVVAVHGSVRDIMRGRFEEIVDLDFIYASGLLDYLDDRMVARLIRLMFERLRSGGTLWVANFMPCTPDRGYMEAVMDWRLVYRTPNQLASLDSEVDGAEVISKRLFMEGEGNIVFLELQKA
jgi:hypothetical protein